MNVVFLDLCFKEFHSRHTMEKVVSLTQMQYEERETYTSAH